MDDAVLVVDELVTNAVMATGVVGEHAYWTALTRIEFIVVRLLGLEASIRIEVWDSASDLPPLPAEDSSAVRRGFYPASCGKVIWAELPIAPGRAEPCAPLYPPPQEFGRQQTNPEFLRRVRDGLKRL